MPAGLSTTSRWLSSNNTLLANNFVADDGFGTKFDSFFSSSGGCRPTPSPFYLDFESLFCEIQSHRSDVDPARVKICRPGFGSQDSGVETLRVPIHARTRLTLALLGFACSLALSGCAGRAYNDLYIENMAAEIRDLEDQLYEYDHQYRVLEQELESLRQQHHSLAPKLSPSHQSSPHSSNSPTSPTQPLEFYPRESAPFVPGPAFPEEVDAEPQSILDLGNDRLEGGSSAGGGATGEPENVMPASPFPRQELPPPPSNNRSLPNSRPTTGSDIDFDLDGLMPPDIELGEPMPPPLTVLPSGDGGLVVSNSLERNLSRVGVNAQLASRGTVVEDGEVVGGGATIRPAVEKVTDTRVVELAFHPSLSRAMNFDDQSDDDGLYLVLQPLNEQGQMVPGAAELSIVVLDPSREGNQARIGRWDLSAGEVQNKLRPIGSSQGIHLTLPWNGPDPGADRVIVFVRYTFTDGRQVIGEKTFFIAGDNGLQTVWAPRGERAGAEASPTATAVAGATQYSTPTDRSQVAQASAVSGSHVVRPAVGSSLPLPAPPPAGLSSGNSTKFR